MRRVALYALTLTVVLSFPADAQPVTAPPTPKREPTRELLPATGQTIAGPSGVRNAPAGTSRAVLGFSATLATSNVGGVCVTLLNNGNGDIGIQLNGAGVSTATITKGNTRAVCLGNVYFVGVDCEGPGTCTFEWRIDRATVSN